MTLTLIIPTAPLQPTSTTQLLLAFTIGLVFGTMFTLTRINELAFVIHQMDFKTFVMVKMFMSALATSVVVMYALSTIPAYKPVLQQLSSYSRSILSLVGGSLLLGVGMTLSGSCPGTVFSQIGSGSRIAWYTFIGCWIGTVVYIVIDSMPAVNKLQDRPTKTASNSVLYQTIDQAFNVPKLYVTACIVAMLLIIGFSLEWFQSYSSELAHALQYTGKTRYYTIPPMLAGVGVGLLQLPSIVFLHKQLGTSASYCTVLCNVSLPLVRRSSHALSSKNSLWQVALVAGITAGAYVTSTYITRAPYQSDYLVSPLRATIGGICLAIGSRFAGGCMSGLGLSVTGHLSVAGFVAVCCMFGGAIGTKMLL